MTIENKSEIRKNDTFQVFFVNNSEIKGNYRAIFNFHSNKNGLILFVALHPYDVRGSNLLLNTTLLQDSCG